MLVFAVLLLSISVEYQTYANTPIEAKAKVTEPCDEALQPITGPATASIIPTQAPDAVSNVITEAQETAPCEDETQPAKAAAVQVPSYIANPASKLPENATNGINQPSQAPGYLPISATAQGTEACEDDSHPALAVTPNVPVSSQSTTPATNIQAPSLSTISTFPSTANKATYGNPDDMPSNGELQNIPQAPPTQAAGEDKPCEEDSPTPQTTAPSIGTVPYQQQPPVNTEAPAQDTQAPTYASPNINDVYSSSPCFSASSLIFLSQIFFQ